MAYTLSAKISIGSHTFTHASRVLINSSWQELGDTCTLCLSDLKELMRSKIQSGMEVSVQLGYDGALREEFKGYVVHISPKIPFELSCEDQVYQLKRLAVHQGKGKAWKNTSLKEVLKDLLRPIGQDLSEKIHVQLSEEMADVHLDQFRIDQGASLAEALQKIKEDFSLCAYFRKGRLFVGPSYAEMSSYKKEESTLASYDMSRDVLENRLIFRRKEEVKLLVKAISVLPDHQKITAQAGDQGGETRILYHPGEKDVAKLRKIAQSALERYKFDGYQGSFLSFGLPYIVHSGVVEIQDKEHSTRQGRYWVKRVRTSWGIEGFRRTIELGPRAEEFSSSNIGEKPAKSDLEDPYIQERGRIFSNLHCKDPESSSGEEHDYDKHRHTLESHMGARFRRFIGLSGLLQRISEDRGVERNSIISGGAATHQDVSAKRPEQASHMIQAKLDPSLRCRLGEENYNKLRVQIEHTQPTPAAFNNSRLGKGIDNVQGEIINDGTLHLIDYRLGINDLRNQRIVQEIRTRFISALKKERQAEEERPGAYSRHCNMLGYFDTVIEALEYETLDRLALARGLALYQGDNPERSTLYEEPLSASEEGNQDRGVSQSKEALEANGNKAFLQDPIKFSTYYPISTVLGDKERWQTGSRKDENIP